MYIICKVNILLLLVSSKGPWAQLGAGPTMVTTSDGMEWKGMEVPIDFLYVNISYIYI